VSIVEGGGGGPLPLNAKLVWRSDRTDLGRQTRQRL
jgi:hypothetical protein